MAISDGDKLNHVVRTGSMSDVGTRMQFLIELHELWETGLDILERFERNTPLYEEKKKELESALKLLYFHMTKDYDTLPDIAAIDAIPSNPEDIPNT